MNDAERGVMMSKAARAGSSRDQQEDRDNDSPWKQARAHTEVATDEEVIGSPHAEAGQNSRS